MLDTCGGWVDHSRKSPFLLLFPSRLLHLLNALQVFIILFTPPFYSFSSSLTCSISLSGKPRRFWNPLPILSIVLISRCPKTAPHTSATTRAALGSLVEIPTKTIHCKVAIEYPIFQGGRVFLLLPPTHDDFGRYVAIHMTFRDKQIICFLVLSSELLLRDKCWVFTYGYEIDKRCLPSISF